MPTYEYRCAECGLHVEVVQSFSDDALTECGACGGPLKKVFGSVGIVFKGSGFYKTDSRGSSKKVAAESSGSGSKSSDSKSSESKSGSEAKSSESGSKSSESGSKSGSSGSSGGSEAKSA